MLLWQQEQLGKFMNEPHCALQSPLLHQSLQCLHLTQLLVKPCIQSIGTGLPTGSPSPCSMLITCWPYCSICCGPSSLFPKAPQQSFPPFYKVSPNLKLSSTIHLFSSLNLLSFPTMTLGPKLRMPTVDESQPLDSLHPQAEPWFSLTDLVHSSFLIISLHLALLL